MAMENQTLGLFMAGPETVFEMVHISLAEIAEENNLPRVLGKGVSVYLQTHLLTKGIAAANKQLLSSNDVE